MISNFISLKNMSRNQIENLIKRSNDLKNGSKIQLKDKTFITLFLEPSTRTKLSFELAAKKIGMNVLNFQADHSSFVKGEGLLDTLETLRALKINIAAIRTKDENIISPLQQLISGISLVNAGEGSSEHPSQALLDAYTIYEHFQTLDNLKICIIGDISHSRVASSNIDLFKKFDSKLTLIDNNNSLLSESQIDNIIKDQDVIMLLRVQHERHKEKIDTTNYNSMFGLNSKRMKLLKENCIIMHPGPINREVEITSEILSHKNVLILKQVENGLYVRMAILEALATERK